MRYWLVIAVVGSVILSNTAAHAAEASEMAAPPAKNAPVCAAGSSNLSGNVVDTTYALIPGATVTLDGNKNISSGADGSFRYACVPDGVHHVSAVFDGFAKLELVIKTPYTSPKGPVLQMVLPPAEVEQAVTVKANGSGLNSDGTGGSVTLSGDDLKTLADDPDDLQLQLQQMAGATSGNPANTVITVDGFQGASALPPKSSIAYIKVNPDMFAAQYNDPQIQGGRVEVYTKPGQKAYHGAVFTTNGSSWENARDPFATSKAAIGKQRYGMELAGPIRKTGSDFAMTFEHRIINDFAVVNAITLDANGTQTPNIYNVPTPQSLWLATARSDWQLNPKNTFIVSYSANVNSLNNQGVGGTTLAQAGYNSQTYEHMLRFSEVTTATASLMHESRLSLRWDGSNDQAESTAPQVSVAGAFTNGGATIGNQQMHELNIEFDDDAIITTKKHTIMFGTQMMVWHDVDQLTSYFNGAYTFGGGVAPVLDSNNQPIAGQTEVITGAQQYVRALNGYAGGTPTAYNSITGTPGIGFTQIMNGLFVQDDWNIGHGLMFHEGLRWETQNYPTSLNNIAPRLGLIYSPGKKSTWTIHSHFGIYTNTNGNFTEQTLLSQDGITHKTSTIYNPVYGNPTAGNPTVISSYRTMAPGFTDGTWEIDNFGGTKTLFKNWNLSADFFHGQIWNARQSENINAPTNGQPTGPRPGPANTNILQLQNSAKGGGRVIFAGLENHGLKHLQFFIGGVWVNLSFTSDNSPTSIPQTTGVETGERAPQTGDNRWNTFGNATLHLPKKVDFSLDGYGGGDGRYNITTGYDNNGDGNFNDRPMFAAPGTPGAVQTPYGLLVDSGGIAVFPRNRGVLPWSFFVNANIQRAWVLTKNKKAEHQQTITANIRSSNVLNHTNVTAVGSVLGSPNFGIPYTAGNGRRVEFGLRYSF